MNQCQCVCDPNSNPVLRLLMLLRGMENSATDALADRPNANWGGTAGAPNSTDSTSTAMTTISLMMFIIFMYVVGQAPKTRSGNGTPGDSTASKRRQGRGPNDDRGGNHDHDMFGI